MTRHIAGPSHCCAKHKDRTSSFLEPAALKSGRRDLNPRPLEPHSSALPSCATARSFGSMHQEKKKTSVLTAATCGRGDRTTKLCYGPRFLRVCINGRKKPAFAVMGATCRRGDRTTRLATASSSDGGLCCGAPQIIAKVQAVASEVLTS
jgi:hypothetical protein